jgi:hypothetical protein
VEAGFRAALEAITPKTGCRLVLRCSEEAVMSKTIEVYLEVGDKRTFAIAADWPGWCRNAKSEDAALEALVNYAPRYAKVLSRTRLGFTAPSDVAALSVEGKLKGNATTDFGATDAQLPNDNAPVTSAELEHWDTILRACWRAFDAAMEAANGKTLTKGPRGGGRELEKIIEHVREVDLAYLNALGGKLKIDKKAASLDLLPEIRKAIQTSLKAAVEGEIPAEGPRGGKRWTPRYFVRRLAWHELDHAWEIEDRAELVK